MEVVPAEVLADTVDRRHVDRDLRALQLDGFLRRLARQEAACRRVLGRLARTFLAGHYHHRLGFARLSDYTRERLGLSARQVQDLARVAERLESLPAIAAAFAAGDLSWTQTRLLATAATADSEREWLALARDRTVRALETLVVRPPPDPDEHHRLRFSLRCPRRVRARWRQAVELARRMAGSELSLAQAAEVIAAERSPPRPLPSTTARRATLRPSPSTRRPTLAGPPSTCPSPRTWRSSSSSDRGGTRSRSTSACAPPGAPCNASTGRWASSSAPSSISACTAPSVSRRRRATSPSGSASRRARPAP